MSNVVSICIVPKTTRSMRYYSVISIERGDYVTLQVLEQGLCFKKHVQEILSDPALLERLLPSDVCLIAYIAGMAHGLQEEPRKQRG